MTERTFRLRDFALWYGLAAVIIGASVYVFGWPMPARSPSTSRYDSSLSPLPGPCCLSARVVPADRPETPGRVADGE